MNLDHSILRRLVSVRYLFQLAQDQSEVNQEAASFASLSLLHDAIEAFLHAASTYLNIGLPVRAEINTYLDEIDKRLEDGVRLPHRPTLTQINKTRVNAKHDGVKPDHSELLGFLSISRQFLESATAMIFAKDFWSLSLIDILTDCEAKSYLSKAEEAARQEDFESCLVLARRALFLEFEKEYDISIFQHETKNFLAEAGCKAPAHAKSKAYIDANVGDPFEYIVIDRSSLDGELARMRIDHATWWNIWRLTPEVYQRTQNGEWLVKHSDAKTMPDGIENRARYVLENTIEVVRKKQIWNRSLRWAHPSRSFVIKPKPNSPIYMKADHSGPVKYLVPETVQQLSVQYGTQGLNDDEFYWSVYSFSAKVNESFLYGYLAESDVDRS